MSMDRGTTFHFILIQNLLIEQDLRISRIRALRRHEWEQKVGDFEREIGRFIERVLKEEG